MLMMRSSVAAEAKQVQIMQSRITQRRPRMRLKERSAGRMPPVAALFKRQLLDRSALFYRMTSLQLVRTHTPQLEFEGRCTLSTRFICFYLKTIFYIFRQMQTIRFVLTLADHARFWRAEPFQNIRIRWCHFRHRSHQHHRPAEEDAPLTPA